MGSGAIPILGSTLGAQQLVGIQNASSATNAITQSLSGHRLSKNGWLDIYRAYNGSRSAYGLENILYNPSSGKMIGDVLQIMHSEQDVALGLYEGADVDVSVTRLWGVHPVLDDVQNPTYAIGRACRGHTATYWYWVDIPTAVSFETPEEALGHLYIQMAKAAA